MQRDLGVVRIRRAGQVIKRVVFIGVKSIGKNERPVRQSQEQDRPDNILCFRGHSFHGKGVAPVGVVTLTVQELGVLGLTEDDADVSLSPEVLSVPTMYL